MRTIGLIGGMSWESSIEYYRIINEAVREKLGGLHSAPLVMHSVEFEEIRALQDGGDWAELTDIMTDAARGLKWAGADFILICTNTMHIMADDVQRRAGIEVLHIADATGEGIKSAGLKKVGLLGTKFTMEKDFYTGRLRDKFGIEAIVPEEAERQEVHDIIFKELCAGIISPESKGRLMKIMAGLTSRGAQGIVLGCTEIPLIIGQGDADVPVFDTTRIHALAAVRKAMA
ncbi:MAG TPA: aspartate/glutamate racemase family protein [Methanocella sp.]|uniref:aspartate/glutamate racemase family protein n=1 Tax=Methanocella sp. TaxID=2052833 RepID=UPI002B5CF8A6|nr:aspartate/glutamate racemase family protein [Methanocella sp.]HTY92105.1 aspartate/glutamate racemase family protein [Methanocella sp.]